MTKERNPWPPETAPSVEKQLKVLDSIRALQTNLQRQISLLDRLYYSLLLGWKYVGRIGDFRKEYHEINVPHMAYAVQLRLRRYEKELRQRAEKLASG